MADFTKAIELDPKYAEAYANRGLVYANLKEMDKAVDDWHKAIELNPGLKEGIKKEAHEFQLDWWFKESDNPFNFLDQ